jgi:methionyl aminopeptidase
VTAAPAPIEILSASDVEAMRTVGRMAGETLVLVARTLRAGMTTEEIDTFVHKDTLRRNATPAPLGYRGFPRSVCVSRNHVVCHGIPSSRERLENGDIVNVDVTTRFNGFHGDTSATFFIGTPTPEARHVVEVARRALAIGIAEVRPGARLGDLGAAIQEFAEAEGCSVVREYGGHGIGRLFHAPPHVSHHGKRGSGVRLREGMAITIEPMVNLGRPEVQLLDDGWTVVTQDRSVSAQFEHTVLVTANGAEILTARHEPLLHSE